MSNPVKKMPNPLRILVVEDNLDSQHLICDMLISMGYVTQGTIDGEAALELLAVKQFDVLFTDVSLPGISGITLAKKAVKNHPRLGIVFASGYDIAIEQHVEFHAISLIKPYDIAQVDSALKNAYTIIQQQATHSGA